MLRSLPMGMTSDEFVAATEFERPAGVNPDAPRPAGSGKAGPTPVRLPVIREWPYLLAAAALVVVFLVANRPLVSGRAVGIWDADYYHSSLQILVADHARHGRVMLWNPWSNGGSPDHADPQSGALSPICVLFGLLTGGTEAGFRWYWLLVWLGGGLGLLTLARHLGAPAWGGFVVALGFVFSGFFTGHAEHTTFIHGYAFLPWIIWRGMRRCAGGGFGRRSRPVPSGGYRPWQGIRVW